MLKYVGTCPRFCGFLVNLAEGAALDFYCESGVLDPGDSQCMRFDCWSIFSEVIWWRQERWLLARLHGMGGAYHGQWQHTVHPPPHTHGQFTVYPHTHRPASPLTHTPTDRSLSTPTPTDRPPHSPTHPRTVHCLPPHPQTGLSTHPHTHGPFTAPSPTHTPTHNLAST